jgi:hypothetical protein
MNNKKKRQTVQKLQERAMSLRQAIAAIKRPLLEAPVADPAPVAAPAPTTGGITDNRSIEFDSNALLAVIGSSSGTNARPTGITISQNQVDLSYDKNNRTVPLTIDQVGALLIQYCTKVQIPISRESKKSVRLTPKSVVLQLRTVYGEPPIPNARTWT